MISALEFVHPVEGEKRAANAIGRALSLSPKVTFLAECGLEKFYRVEGSEMHRYLIILFTDQDGQQFIECNCHAGTPMTDLKTGLPAWAARPCYHAAAVLLFEAAKIDLRQLELPFEEREMK